MKRQESRGKYLVKNTAIFALGNIATKLITFFLVPLYTNILTTSEYGVVDLINTICTVLTPLIVFNIGEAVMRFSLDKDADYDKIMSVGLVAFVVAFFLGLVSFPVTFFYPIVSDYSVSVYLFLVTTAASQIYLCYLRGKEKLVLYSIGNIIHTLLIAVFNILFLAVLKMGVSGFFLAYTISNAITIIYAFFAGNVFDVIKHFSFDGNLAKKMLKFSVVLIPNAFMWWIINSSDRIMVSSMIGVDANGIYAISYKLPTLVITITGIFNQAWNYSAIREEGKEDETTYNNAVLKYLISIVIVISIFLLLILKVFLKYYVAFEYYSAWKYSPFLIVGSAYLTLSTFIGTSYNVHKDSVGFLLSAFIGAICNIVLNFLLIPFIDVYGAALATCISYIVVFVFRLLHTRKYIHYDVNNFEFYIGAILILLASVFVYTNSVIGVIIQLFIFFIAIFVYSHTWIPIIKSIIKRIGKN